MSERPNYSAHDVDGVIHAPQCWIDEWGPIPGYELEQDMGLVQVWRKLPESSASTVFSTEGESDG